MSAGQTKAEPHYEAHAGRLADLIGDLLRLQNGARLAADIAAGLRAGQAFANAYAQAKRAAGVADFNDLIEWTRRPARKPGMGEWVRYKLDRQVDHVLVDEAQDTNAAQWDIIERLVEEFFSGSSEAERRVRTLFMVGDFKQAIYGFQGTDPRRFQEAREMFKRRAAALSAGDDLFSYRRRGAGISRPVDRCELPLGAAGARRRRCRDRDGRARRSGAQERAAAASRASPGPSRHRSSCGSRLRSSNRPTRATKARSVGSACATATMRTRWPNAFGR